MISVSSIHEYHTTLYERLNNDEDKDIECIVSNLLGIAERLSLKMYDYGEIYARKANDCDVDKIICFMRI